MFPVEIASRSIEEYYWPKEAAIMAVEFLAGKEYPVVGLEHVKREGNKWRVLECSSYDAALDDRLNAETIDRQIYVKECRMAALRFLAEKPQAEGEYFIITWLDESDS